MITVTLLGTAATMPLPDRALTAAVLECSGHSLLFDCGEGTQAAARRAGVSLMKLDGICLTHWHGDHIFGLPGLLQTLGCQGREKPLALFAPAGDAGLLEALRVLTGPLPYPLLPALLPPEGLDLAALGWPTGAALSAFPTRHRVASQGYCFTLARAGKFDPQRARALGVPMPLWGRLQKGETVSAGARLVRPEEVLGPARRGCGWFFPAIPPPAPPWTRPPGGRIFCSATPPTPPTTTPTRRPFTVTAPSPSAGRWRPGRGPGGWAWAASGRRRGTPPFSTPAWGRLTGCSTAPARC